MLDQIVKVKEFRFDSAKKALALAKRHLEQCIADLEAHKQAILEYKEFIKKEKVRLFTEIENEQIELKQLDRYQQELDFMKQHLDSLNAKTPEFEEAVKEAEKKLQESRGVYKKCNADLQKYKEIGAEMAENEKREQEYKEEVELEDRIHKGNS